MRFEAAIESFGTPKKVCDPTMDSGSRSVKKRVGGPMAPD